MEPGQGPDHGDACYPHHEHHGPAPAQVALLTGSLTAGAVSVAPLVLSAVGMEPTFVTDVARNAFLCMLGELPMSAYGAIPHAVGGALQAVSGGVLGQGGLVDAGAASGMILLSGTTLIDRLAGEAERLGLDRATQRHLATAAKAVAAGLGVSALVAAGSPAVGDGVASIVMAVSDNEALARQALLWLGSAQMHSHSHDFLASIGGSVGAVGGAAAAHVSCLAAALGSAASAWFTSHEKAQQGDDALTRLRNTLLSFGRTFYG